MARPITPIHLSSGQQAVLERFTTSGKTPHDLFQRCQIILMSASGMTNKHISQTLPLHKNQVAQWRQRWLDGCAKLAQWEDKPKQLAPAIQSLLSDLPRSGAPCTFTEEQICRLIALACETPPDHLSHWTQVELARTAVERGIVETISTSSIERFLKSGRFKATSHSILVKSRSGR